MVDNTDNRPILVVEDIQEISSQMGAILRGKGQRVIYATDAESAIQMAENDHPRMILTDPDLPTFDALIGLIRQHGDLNKMIVAIIDINGPHLDPQGHVMVLDNLKELDKLLLSAARVATD